MSATEKELRSVSGQEQGEVGAKIDDREGLLGLVALISLAIPALLIRILLPDLNPVILAGLGVAVYAVYLATLLSTLSRQANEEERTLQAAKARAYRE